MVSYYPIVLLLGIILIWFMWRYALAFLNIYRGRDLDIGRVYREFCLCLLVFFGLIIIVLTFYPFKIPLYNYSMKGNLILFHSIYKFIIQERYLGLMMNVFGNLFLLLPIGFLVAMLYSNVHSYKKMLGLGFIVSLSIEVLQLILRVRYFDIEDLFLNSVGCMMGYYFYLLMCRHSALFENIVEGGIAKSRIKIKKIILPIMLMLIFSSSLYVHSFFNNSITKNEFLQVMQKSEMEFEQGLQIYLINSDDENIKMKVYAKLVLSRYYLSDEIVEKCEDSCYKYFIAKDYAGYNDEIVVILFGKDIDKKIEKVAVNDKVFEVINEDEYFIVDVTIDKNKLAQKLQLKYLTNDEKIIFELER